MTPEEIKNRLLKLLSNIAPEIDAQAINPTEPLRDQVDIDSIDFLNFIVKIHEELGIEIPESDYSQLTTLEKMVSYLISKK